MAFTANDALQLAKSLAQRWLGFRYVVFSVPQAGVSFASIAQNLASVGIQEIVFPTVTIEQFSVPTTSTREYYVPTRLSHSDLVLRAPVLRNSGLWARVNLQKEALIDPTQFDNVPEILVVSEFEINTVVDTVPIATWVCEGVQLKTFTTAAANAQGHGIVPLEEARFQVDDFYRVA